MPLEVTFVFLSGRNKIQKPCDLKASTLFRCLFFFSAFSSALRTAGAGWHRRRLRQRAAARRRSRAAPKAAGRALPSSCGPDEAVTREGEHASPWTAMTF